MDIYLSTIGKNAADLARKHGFGIEIAEFSYAANMDTDFAYWDELTRANLSGIGRRVFHAPFNELCPSAVDPLIVEVTRRRLEQAYSLMRSYDINRMVVHSGYLPHLYVKDWFAGQSAEFWRCFLLGKPADFSLLLENVMEESPEMLLDIIKRTGDERFRLCLDLGHAGGRFSDLPVIEWVEISAPCLKHVHVHNNYRTGDLHNPPGDGHIDIDAALSKITELCPDATFTMETADLQSAISWLEARRKPAARTGTGSVP